MSTAPFAARKSFGDIAPKLAELSGELLFGDVRERPRLELGLAAAKE
jgi:4-carboxymuconolactone decarboxylase